MANKKGHRITMALVSMFILVHEIKHPICFQMGCLLIPFHGIDYSFFDGQLHEQIVNILPNVNFS